MSLARFLSAALAFLLILFGVHPLRGETPPSSSEKIEVHSYVDSQSSGWAYKKNDVAFVAEKEGCRIQWNAVESNLPEGGKTLAVRRNCSLPFAAQIPLHRAILKAIEQKWPLPSFNVLSWGSFGNISDASWNLPIALAAWKAPEYQDYRLHYPQSKLTNINQFFVEKANETRAYSELEKLMNEFGVKIVLSGVEKVFAQKAKELPFFLQLKEKGVPPDMRLIYDVAFSYFKIQKAP